jgi:DNA-3-methyladenine glycosylase
MRTRTFPEPYPRAFFRRDSATVARELLGGFVIRRLPDGVVIARIVETEAYGGLDDLGCHAGRFGRTPRTEPLFGPVGYAYAYPVHMNVFCFNVIAHPPRGIGGVLFRALEPVHITPSVLDNIRARSPHPAERIFNGPGKLCRALAINSSFNRRDLLNPAADLYLARGPRIPDDRVAVGPRINIPYARHCIAWPLRFTERRSRFLSRP